MLARLVFRYDANLDFWSFEDARGVRLKDHKGKSVALYPVTTLDGSLRCQVEPFTDVLVLVEGTLTLGWLLSDEVQSLGPDGFAANVKSLHAMPTDFAFVQTCPHMSVFGGVWHDDDQTWECFGCGLRLQR